MDALLIPTFFCPKAWEGMTGNEATRHCSYCNKHVHNLDALSVSERLALLSSPAAQICARYKIAIRRPKPGRKESYARHLAKYGVGVAITGSAMLVLWEMYERGTRMPRMSSHYRAVAPDSICGGYVPMPEDLYDETEVMFLGGISPIYPKPPSTVSCPPSEMRSNSVDVRLDPIQMQGLLKSTPAPTFPPILLPAVTKKKAGN